MNQIANRIMLFIENDPEAVVALMIVAALCACLVMAVGFAGVQEAFL